MDEKKYWHKHRCVCGFIWEHSEDMSGLDHAHKCPNCGAMVWTKYRGSEKADFVGCGIPKKQMGRTEEDEAIQTELRDALIALRDLHNAVKSLPEEAFSEQSEGFSQAIMDKAAEVLKRNEEHLK